MKDWQDIKVGESYRFKNSLNVELDRKVISVDKKKVTYQRAEVEEGKLSDIAPERFIKYYNANGVPYDPQFSGDWVEACIDPDFDFD